MSIEAMKQALEALEHGLQYVVIHSANKYRMEYEQAITSLRQAIAEAEKQEHEFVCGKCVKCGASIEKQEPVAILQRYPSKGLLTVDYTDEITEVQEGTWPLYTHPQPKAEQPKVRTGDCLLTGVCASEGHKIQPKREPLTDEELEAIAKQHIAVGTRSFEEFARRIEAAHGIKE